MTTEPAVHFAQVYYTGRVQGVGFRYQTYELAKGFEITGFVRNLVDGRVELEAEGTEREVKDFLVSIEERMAGYIRKVEKNETNRSRAHRQFAIR